MELAARAAAEDALQRLLPRFGIPVERHAVASRAGRLHYLAAGQGPRVVLLHGGFGGAGNWYRTLGPLARHFRVLAPDRPGYGLADDEREGDPTAWLAALAAAAGGALAAVVSHASAGAVALAWAARRPAGLRALVLGDLELTAAEYTPPANLRGGRRARRVESWYAGVAARFDDRRLLAPEYLYYLWCLAQLRPEQDQRPPGDAAPGPVPLPGAGARTWPTLPMLLVHGRGNRWTPHALVRELRVRVPDAELRLVEHSKGIPQLEQPGEYNYAVINFLRRHLAG